MQRQGGGGNNPTCGCDMQAGWPSASELPRGGIQGGGGRRLKLNCRVINTNNNQSRTNRNTLPSSEPPSARTRSMKKMAYKGKRYFVNKGTRKVYSMLSSGKVGSEVGSLKMKNGRKTLVKTNKPTTSMPPPLSNSVNDYDTEDMSTMGSMKTGTEPLSQAGGARKRRMTRKHKSKCGCFLCSFQKLKLLSGK